MSIEYLRSQNFAKMSGRALFIPDGQVGALDLGDIVMHKLNYNTGTVEVMRHRKGASVLADQAVTEVKPVYEIDLGEEFAPLMPLMLFGTQGADTTQGTATASTLAIASSKKLQSYMLGKYGVTNVVVTSTGPVTYVQDTDYQLDADQGVITIMNGGTIADATALTVTFNVPAIAVINNFTPMSQLNRRGMLTIFEEDTFDTKFRNRINAYANLYPKQLGDRDAKKYSAQKIEAAILSTFTWQSIPR